MLPVIISLYDYTGNWSRPYREAGYRVHQIDLKHGQDVRLFKALDAPVRGVICAPPCTIFARSGARWWPDKGEAGLLEGLALVDACCRIVVVHTPRWWVLENPIGRLNHWLGKPLMRFDPADYGDAYTKRTCLWGSFTPPMKRRIQAVARNPLYNLPESARRSALRSETPQGFATAFFEANP